MQMKGVSERIGHVLRLILNMICISIMTLDMICVSNQVFDEIMHIIYRDEYRTAATVCILRGFVKLKKNK